MVFLINCLIDMICPVQESVKPVFQGTDESAKSAARSVLVTCIDTGLKLISPFMPFISEELWQRLPRPESVQSNFKIWNLFFFLPVWLDYFDFIIESLPPSICIAAYPTDEEFGVWKDQRLEEDVKLISRIIASVRSVRASYMLPNKTKTKLVLRCTDQEVIWFQIDILSWISLYWNE